MKSADIVLATFGIIALLLIFMSISGLVLVSMDDREALEMLLR